MIMRCVDGGSGTQVADIGSWVWGKKEGSSGALTSSEVGISPFSLPCSCCCAFELVDSWMLSTSESVKAGSALVSAVSAGLVHWLRIQEVCTFTLSHFASNSLNTVSLA